MGTSDCPIGLGDGVNEAGLAVSLTFGGSRRVGDGFGVPIILRYVLETCATTRETAEALRRTPSHMAYNVTVVDAERRVRTVQLTPNRPEEITHAAVATNHQGRLVPGEAVRATATVKRERFLLQRLTLHEESLEDFITAFLRPPLYSLAFQRGFGTLFTAVYRPHRRQMRDFWPGNSWALHLDEFREAAVQVSYLEHG